MQAAASMMCLLLLFTACTGGGHSHKSEFCGHVSRVEDALLRAKASRESGTSSDESIRVLRRLRPDVERDVRVFVDEGDDAGAGQARAVSIWVRRVLRGVALTFNGFDRVLGPASDAVGGVESGYCAGVSAGSG